MSTEHIDHAVARDRTTAFSEVHDIQSLTTTRPITVPGREGSRKPTERSR